MSVARMTKVSILAPRAMREELVDRLHGLGAVHVNDVASASVEDEELRAYHVPFEPETRGLRLSIARTDFIIDLLERLEDAKGGLVSGFLKERVHLGLDEFLEIERDFDLESAYRELEALDIELRRIESAVTALEEDIDAMLPWEGLDCPLGEAYGLESASFRPLIASAAAFAAWEKEVDSRCPRSTREEAGRERDRVYVAVIVHREDLEEFDTISAEYGFETARLEGKAGTVAEEMSRSRAELEAEMENRSRVEEGIRGKLPLKPQVLALNDFLHNQLAKEEVKRRFVHTRSVVALEGWIEESRTEEVHEEIETLGTSTDVVFSPPEDGDEPPTLMVNRRRIRPAETLIELFGIPNHEETDPTPFVAPFFILFFGMCIGDVGYGLIMAGAFWLALKKLDVSENVRRFLRLFMYCGLASIFMGVITRGYFGIDGYLGVEGKSLPAFMKFPGTMDLLYEPIPFMIICLALGLIHISIGVAIEMRDNIKHNSLWIGLCEQGTTLLFWLGIAVAAIGFGIGVKPLGQAGIYIAAAGVASVILLSNVKSKNLAGKFFGGLYNFYGLFASTIGDVASYLRLYALGLATIAIGMVVNIMASLVWGIPVLGIIALLVILLGGHIFNMAVSFLSAFVHPLRLQYVEFFGKFYEDGGVPFTPLALETRKTVIDK
ncbi:MAG: V-type ATP synthase subunit I [Actinomycetota bacterium]|nr:V-type ATP synthase subunit I [Actinomycetota bacterium]MDD5666483.1 V-type ATP synthase subunit I [Actinomycetota bacterium]